MVQSIREKLVELLNGAIDLETFENWFLPATWDISESSDPAAHELAGQIRLALAEAADGHLDEGELQERLRSLASPSVDFDLAPVTIASDDNLDEDAQFTEAEEWSLTPV